jgi:hypothetical protein
MSMSNESPMSVTATLPEIFVFEMAPGQDTLPPDDPECMEGWFWNFDDGNCDPVFGPFASEEAARADAQEKIDERLAFAAAADSEVVQVAQAIHAAMRGQTEIRLGQLCWAMRKEKEIRLGPWHGNPTPEQLAQIVKLVGMMIDKRKREQAR